jgi:Icc-related predicted phosphoesterase
MKLLAFSDLHTDLVQAEKLIALSAEADVVIGAGDFASQHERLGPTIAALAAITKPTILVPGNNETEAALREAAAGWESATVLHGEGTEIDGVPFYALGAGIPETPWGWSFDLGEEAAGGMLADCPEGAVLVVHSPPLGHCDEDSAGRSLGSAAILAAIEEKRPRLTVCGHIHESWGARSAVGESEIANLGPRGATFDV